MTTGQTKERETMTNADKKKWSTPRLRVFARTRAEERVLAGCKTKYITGDPLNSWAGCYKTGFVDAPCAIACATNSGS